jgi:enoyl-CoA hydratase
MALMCDIRIATQEARFSMPEGKLSLIPAAGGTQTIPRSIGLGRSLEFLLTGRVINATTASQIGLIAKVVPESELITQAHVMATKLANLDPGLVKQAKRAIVRGAEMDIDQGLQWEKHLISYMHSINTNNLKL